MPAGSPSAEDPPHRRAEGRLLPWPGSGTRGVLALLTGWLLSSCDGKKGAEAGEEPRNLEPAAQGKSALGELAGQNPVHTWQKVDDPAADGWESEILAEQAKKQLGKLGALILSGKAGTAEDLAPFLARGFSGSQLVPPRPLVVFNDATVWVERAPAGEKGLEISTDFQAAVKAAAREFSSAQETYAEFKVVEVATEGDSTEGPPAFTSRQIVSFSGKTGEGVVEHHATWVTRWSQRAKVDADSPPKLTSLEVQDFERAVSKRSWFADGSGAVMDGDPVYSAQILRGMNHWLERIPYRASLNPMGTPGVALGDVNGDGLDDLYLCQEPGLPNRLFVQEPDGRLKDQSVKWGVDWLQDSRSALLVDLDNDGRQDLAVAIFGGIVVAQNMGSRFEIRAVLPTSESTTSLTAVDYDRDGRLDLYVCAYDQDRNTEADAPALGPLGGRFVFHDAVDGGPNTLYRNDISAASGWRFTDTTAASGLDQDNTRWSFSAAWDDVDNDGDPDLYVANDYGRNCLYRNEAGPGVAAKFRNIAGAAGAEDPASGMSAAWGDYDRDGWMDLYIGNMFSSAGSRITRQAQFKPHLDSGLRRTFQHFARGNTLLRNLARPDQPGFEDTSVAAAVTIGRWAWSSNFVDLNNDGWEDIVVANGYLTGDEDGGDL